MVLVLIIRLLHDLPSYFFFSEMTTKQKNDRYIFGYPIYSDKKEHTHMKCIRENESIHISSSS
jgi:hypothetical protein